MDTQTPDPIEPGQTYRPMPYNKAREPEDRITVRDVYTGEGRDEPTVAYDIASTDHRGRPVTTSSAMRESVFRKCYALDTPEGPITYDAPLDRLAASVTVPGTLVVIQPEGSDPDALRVDIQTKGLDPARVACALRHLADRLDAEAVQQHPAGPFGSLLDYLAEAMADDILAAGRRSCAEHARYRDRLARDLGLDDEHQAVEG
ncbi:hypothetical protein HHL19_12905 [Streptomyces sp. R302]|uniref:hypothetical protein n=1 Tax=unclassified Streptomyces TaxID=2593676 RepID=UPI00145C5D7E|nr:MULTISPECIES: hypothetical protein [unclassified Streptomyces]NML50560.1 hypothetical protein [Streptomyces sp. R301]NML79551.1 hypothetical protein [Streptomyces sp. R302]